jgi:hypothetical protein
MNKESLYSKMGLQFFAEPGSGAEGGAGGTEGGQGGADPKTFTQEQVNGMMAAEKRSGRLALLKELGYEVKEGAKASDVIAQVKGILDSGKTQQQKDQEAREKAEGDLSAEQAKSKQLQAKIDAMTAGVKPDYVDDAIALLSPRVTDQKPLSKLLEESKEKYPNWFGEAEGSKGTGGSTNPPRGKGTSTEGLGKRLAQANKPATKSSFFKN